MCVGKVLYFRYSILQLVLLLKMISESDKQNILKRKNVNWFFYYEKQKTWE